MLEIPAIFYQRLIEEQNRLAVTNPSANRPDILSKKISEEVQRITSIQQKKKQLSDNLVKLRKDFNEISKKIESDINVLQLECKHEIRNDGEDWSECLICHKTIK